MSIKLKVKNVNSKIIKKIKQNQAITKHKFIFNRYKYKYILRPTYVVLLVYPL